MMSGLMIGWEYLTGYMVATDPSSRERAEWPPHPGRVFMAMAAAYFETGEDPAEGASLRWLERQGVPELHLPSRKNVFERSLVKVYVPVNDKAGPAKAPLQSSPAMTRSRQRRTFPCVHVGDKPCFMFWPNAEDVTKHRDALDRLCDKVTRIGHSSSLVRMWVADSNDLNDTTIEQWEPADVTATNHCRVITAGFLDSLPDQTQIPKIEAFANICIRIESAEQLQAEAKRRQDKVGQKAANQELKLAKEDYKKLFNDNWKRSVRPPSLLRPKLGTWSGYCRVDHADCEFEINQTHFDPDILVLTQVANFSLPLVSTLIVTQALRGAVMKHSSIQPVPQWASGHQPSGARSEEDSGHIACIPLPFVGREHANGHLMGVGLVFPRSVPRRERGRVLGKMLFNSDGQPCQVKLVLGHIGVWTVQKQNCLDAAYTLRPWTWTASPAGSTTWATVTPVVLDKFPKSDRMKDRSGWIKEVSGIITEACKRIGLPEPVGVDLDTTSWHLGCPRAVGKRRPLRGKLAKHEGDAGLGVGFPFFPGKGTKTSRPQVHVWLRFAQPVIGPILLGAGRYQGYGLCKPCSERTEEWR